MLQVLNNKKIGFLKKHSILLYSILILIVSFFSYFRFYDHPNAQFWDENYHVASAYKYLNGVYFMESHPPLGKLFVALGEKMFNPNSKLNTKNFLSTDYIKKFPKGFKFKGVRFFSTFFAMLSALIFFFILLSLLKNKELALIFTTFYLFENANIIHSRSAMLEGSQIFFIFCTILIFVRSINRDIGVRILDYILMGFFAGLAISVKLNGMIVLLFFVALFIFDNLSRFKDLFVSSKFELKNILFLFKSLALKSVVSIFVILLVLFSVFYIHFSLVKYVEKGRYYGASPEYKRILREGQTSNPKYFFVMLRDYFKYVRHYEKGVPKYNPCKKGENGSPAISWPVGKKAINYRWAKNNGYVRYLYLQGNPIIWLSGLLGVLFSFSLIVSVLVYDTRIKDKRLFSFIVVFFSVYVSYMIAILRIDRVMYLYHYLIPLFFSVFLFVLSFYYMFMDQLHKKEFRIALALFIVLVIFVYAYFSPLTYYQPLNSVEFNKRVWFDFWGLKHV